MLKGKHIIVGITGSIAAYKAASLVRLLVKEGAEVKVVMTELAKQFITPLTLATLSKHPVMVEFYNPENGDWHSHVDMGLWADLYLIAPATANTLGKMAHGIADNLLLTTYLSAKCPVMVAPAMDLDMYRHPATRQNLHILQSYGVRVIEPAAGELASGLVGKGRMAEPEEIVASIHRYFERQGDLLGKKVLLTAGPTYEKIDPVRFIGNYSSGKMGFALAEEFAARGAEVVLVAGLPKDSLEGFQYTLEQVLALAPENITVHTLALKKGSRLAMERQGLPSGAETAAMLEYAWKRLREAGYLPYYLYRQKYMSGALENIGWCKPGCEGVYNICIMEELHTILALGGGGSTKLTDPETGKIVRITNPKYPHVYLERVEQVCQNKAELVPFHLALRQRARGTS